MVITGDVFDVGDVILAIFGSCHQQWSISHNFVDVSFKGLHDICVILIAVRVDWSLPAMSFVIACAIRVISSEDDGVSSWQLQLCGASVATPPFRGLPMILHVYFAIHFW